MNKKRLIITSLFSIFLVSILLIGSTYSIFTTTEIDENTNVYKTGNLNITYKVSSNTVHFTDTTPMTIEEADAVIPYRITVTNSGNVDYQFDVILEDTTASDVIDYQYIMTKVGYLDPISLNNCTNNIIKEDVIVPAGQSVDIDIRLWLDSTLPNTQIGKSFYAKLKIDGLAVHNDNEEIDNSNLSLRYMNTSSTNDFRSDTYRTYIKTASFVDYIDTSNASINSETNAKIMWDMSTSQDNSVIAWLQDNGTTDENGNKLYDLYIGCKDKIYAKSLKNFFTGMSAIVNFYFNNLDTSLTTSMLSIFEDCSSIKTLDLSSFDTSNVTVMNVPGDYAYGGMFRDCSSLEYLDVSSFDTSNIKLFGNMFNGCISLLELDVSGFDTSSATNTAGMFANCKKLANLDLSNFDTSNVTNMNTMFYKCSSLTNLDLNNFVTLNVTDMYNMFNGCSSLTSLDVSNFDTHQVTLMMYMFAGCSSLTSLDISNFDTHQVTMMTNMFSECRSLTSLDLSNFDTSNVTDMYNMFGDCHNLTNLNLSNFDTSNVTKMNTMFNHCYNLKTAITIKNISTTYSLMFNIAATAEGASIKVYYVGDNPDTEANESTESLVNSMVGSSNPNIINAGCKGDYCPIEETTEETVVEETPEEVTG